MIRLMWKRRPLTLRRIICYLRRKLRKKETARQPSAPEPSWDWKRLAEALGALEEELAAVHSLLQELSASPPPRHSP